MRKANLSKIDFFLKFGFDKQEWSDLFSNKNIWLEIKQITNLKQEELIGMLDKEFDSITEKIKKLSNETWKKIVLALSGWIDSVLISNILSKNNIDFSSISISYDKWFDETDLIKKYVWDNLNIKYKRYSSSESMWNIQNIVFKNTVSHPTLMSYYNLSQAVDDNSLLVTWDLWDEIFGLSENMDSFEKPIIFSSEEISMLLGLPNNQEFLYKDVSSELFRDIDVWFNNITYKMMDNCLYGRDIIYYPFYSWFYKYISLINRFNINSQDKSYLRNYLQNNFSINIEEKKQWFKYPVLEEVIDQYYQYIYDNYSTIDCFNINIDFVEEILKEENIKSKRWKLFTIAVFIYLIKHDNRFFKNW